jgi:hypothetical protein
MLVFGVEVPDLDEDCGTPVDVLCIIKCLKAEGDDSSDGYPYRLVTRSSRTLGLFGCRRSRSTMNSMSAMTVTEFRHHGHTR